MSTFGQTLKAARLAGLDHHDCALRGDVGPCDCAVGRALNENSPDGDGRQR